MTDACPPNSAGPARGDEEGAAAGIARWLSLAAAPTFAVMALLTEVLDGGPLDLLCSTGHGSPLVGMVPMYLLMSIFHSAAWLRLLSGRQSGARRT